MVWLFEKEKQCSFWKSKAKAQLPTQATNQHLRLLGGGTFKMVHQKMYFLV